MLKSAGNARGGEANLLRLTHRGVLRNCSEAPSGAGRIKAAQPELGSASLRSEGEEVENGVRLA